MFRSQAPTQKDLHRRIFLNTMRNVYPNSLQISYTYAEDEARFQLKPLSVSHKCPAISDKLWTDLLAKLHQIFLEHVHVRFRVMFCTWALLVVSAVLYGVFGAVFHQLNQLWYQLTGPIVFGIGWLLIPNAVFTQLTIRPTLASFEQWKRNTVIQFDKCGIEVIKITTGELVSDKSAWRWLGMLYYGSAFWFRFEDVQVELFWRSVKSSSRVRRYSLMITNSAPANDETGKAVAESVENSIETLGDVPKIVIDQQ